MVGDIQSHGDPGEMRIACQQSVEFHDKIVILLPIGLYEDF